MLKILIIMVCLNLRLEISFKMRLWRTKMFESEIFKARQKSLKSSKILGYTVHIIIEQVLFFTNFYSLWQVHSMMLYSWNCQLHDKQLKDLKSQGLQNLIHSNQQNHNYEIWSSALHYDITVGALVNWLITCPNITLNYPILKAVQYIPLLSYRA